VEALHTLLTKSFPKNAKLLEIGCGSGRDAKFMMESGYHVTAIDGSSKMINEAKQIHPTLTPHLLVKQLPHGLDFQTNSFDGIYSIATLMHLEPKEIEESIEKIYRLLKPKGKFLFSVSLQRDDTNTNHRDKHNRLFTSLTEKEWTELCTHQGFRILYYRSHRGWVEPKWDCLAFLCGGESLVFFANYLFI
jgi:ubiquinone/menaquinone biosynthesis C-methylase UbiE